MANRVESVFGDQGIGEEALEACLDRSLAPRPPAMLYDVLAGLGVGPAHTVLDVGCRDAHQALEIARRFGCRVVGIERVREGVAEGRRRIEQAGLRGQVAVVQGDATAIPLGDRTGDLVWCRDMLTHVADLERGVGECHRVLAAGGRMLVYVTLATERLEPAEAAELFGPLAVAPDSARRDRVEAAFAGAGFALERREEIASEWREALEEGGQRATSLQLLRIARMLRARERLRAEVGALAYDVELANCRWGVYQMLGKLCPTIYLLRKADGL